jgi:hypothetical protein
MDAGTQAVNVSSILENAMRIFTKPTLERGARVSHMKSIKKSLAVLAIAGLCVSAFAPVAAARGLGGYGGHADNPSQATSFSEIWNSVSWNGSGTARWDIPLVIDPVGNYSPTAWVYVNGVSSNVSCTVQAVNQNEGTISNTRWVSPGVGNAWTSVNPGTVTTVYNGSLEMACFLGKGSRIQTVAW